MITKIYYRTVDKTQSNIRLRRKAKNYRSENVAGSISLSLFINGSDKSKVHVQTPRTNISRIQHENMMSIKLLTIKIPNTKCLHMECISWQAAQLRPMVRTVKKRTERFDLKTDTIFFMCKQTLYLTSHNNIRPIKRNHPA